MCRCVCQCRPRERALLLCLMRRCAATQKALMLSGQPFCMKHKGCVCSGFPVLVKASEAEKNYLAQQANAAKKEAAGALSSNRLYVGNLHHNIAEVRCARRAACARRAS